MAGNKRKRSKKSPDIDNFHVEVITKVRVAANTTGDPVWQYRVKWAGYPSDSDTWEPEVNLASCDRLVNSFWKDIGTDDKDYTLGTELVPSDQWIENEKKRFRTVYMLELGIKERRRLQKLMTLAEETETRQVSKSKTSSSTSKKLAESDANSSSSEDELGPIREKSHSQPPLKINLPPKKKQKIVISDDDSDDSDDLPLAQSKAVHDAKQTRDEVKRDSIPGEPSMPSLFSPEPSPDISHQNGPPSPISVPQQLKSISAQSFIPRHLKDPHVKISKNQVAELPLSSKGLTTKQRIAQGALAPTLPKDIPATELNPTKRPNKTSLPTRNPLGFKKGPIPSLPTRTGSGSAFSTSPVVQSPVEFISSASALSPRLSTFSPPTPQPPSLPTRTGSGPAFLTSPVVQSPVEPFISAGVLSPRLDTFSPLTLQPPSDSPQAPVPSKMISPVQQSSLVQIHPILPNVPVNVLDMGMPPLSRGPTEIASTIAPTKEPMSETDKFLADIMPESFLMPLDPPPEMLFEPSIKPIQAKAPLPGRIPKTFKWSGTLHLAQEDLEICNVKIQNVTQEQPQALRFSLVLQNIRKISMEELYDNADVLTMISAFRNPSQFGVLSEDAPTDKEPFATAVAWLEKSKKSFMNPIILDDNVIGYLLFFHSSFTQMKTLLHVPAHVSNPDGLIVALLPWTLSPDQIAASPRSIKLPPLMKQVQSETSLVRNPYYHHGIRNLAFPNQLFDFFSQRAPLAYTIWADTLPGMRKVTMEVKMLEEIMKEARGKRLPEASACRVLFVHFEALRTLHRIPGLARRRAEQPELTFYTFGTQPGLSPDSWRIQEIYPMGGVVTFTASAILQDPVSFRHRIEQISKHPSWTAYVMPSTLGVLAKLECPVKDPFLELREGTLRLAGLLECIEDGLISLLTSPPEHYTDERDYQSISQWTKQYLRLRPFKPEESLRLGTKAFLENAKLASADVHEELEQLIEEDLLLMQRQPIIMTKYRRYVVVNSNKPNSRHSGEHHGIEWTTSRRLDFKDDFFPKQTIGMQ